MDRVRAASLAGFGQIDDYEVIEIHDLATPWGLASDILDGLVVNRRDAELMEPLAKACSFLPVDVPPPAGAAKRMVEVFWNAS